jgi:hypothetical protein
VCHAILQDPKFHDFLRCIDEDEARRVCAAGCRRCEARLHSARYPRKPRGAPRAVRGAKVRRASFCCARCRQRRTPMSVRFLGRRVYLGAVVVLATALANGFNGRRLIDLGAKLEVPARTLLRWRQWWLGEFVATPLWSAARGRLMPPVAEEQLPASLLGRFDGDDGQRLVLALRLVAPLSTMSEAG